MNSKSNRSKHMQEMRARRLTKLGIYVDPHGRGVNKKFSILIPLDELNWWKNEQTERSN